jgi:hypothetical protein
VTEGAGSEGCSALSGAASDAAAYAISSAQHGGFSWSGLGHATLTGAENGLASGPLGGDLGSVGGDLVDEAAAGARAPILADTNVLVRAFRGHSGAQELLTSGSTHMTSGVEKEF